jgi:predicted nucleic acid-binding protein
MQGIYDSEDMRIERSSRRDEVKAIEFFRKFADQKVSFTDCLSFAIMNRVGLKEVFTFDRHFGLAGFNLIQ